MEEQEPLLSSIQYSKNGTSSYDKQGDSENGHGEDNKRCYLPRRYILIFMLFLGTANSFALRVNFNVALLAMVNSTQEDNTNGTSNQCPGNGNIANSTSNKGDGEFDWSPGLQSILLGAFYYGYTVGQLFCGVLAERFGARRLLIVAGVCGGVFNLLIPVTARWNVYALIVLRVVLGLGMGPVWPGMASMMPRWTLTTERTKLYAIANSGIFIGTVVSQSLSGVLCDSTILGGWPATFYLFGVLSLVYSGCFWLLTADTPAQHKSISKQEREMIEANTGDTTYQRLPFGKIIRSRAVWCLFIMLFADITSYDIIFTYLPLYMKRVLKYDIAASGGLASLPYITCMVTTCLAGYSADFIMNRGWMSTMNIRRLFTIIGDIGAALCIVVITFLNCDRTMVVILFILCISVAGFNNGGFGVNVFDIAPRYAGSIYGIINGLSNIGGFAGPLLVGAITHNSGDMALWHSVFYIVAAVYATGVLVFCVFGSADLQPWAKAQHAYDNLEEASASTQRKDVIISKPKTV